MKIVYFLLVTICFYSSVNAQVINIPDAKFKAKLLAANETNTIAKDVGGSFFKIDVNNNGEIEVSEALQVSQLNVTNASITSLVGITNFINLNIFYCSENSLSSINLSGLVNLYFLDCSNNTISTLDVSSLRSFQSLICSNNNLSGLDLRGLANFQELDCKYNVLSSLNVSGLTKLKYIDCSSNQLTSLNVTGLTNLISLHFNFNQVTTFDCSTLINLQSLGCNNNKIASLNVIDLVKLSSLFCEYNQISLVDVGNLINLEWLACSSNNISTLDVSNLKKLTNLYCNANPNLTTLFLKNGTKENILSFANNTALKYICADDNQLDEIQNQISNSSNPNCVVSSYCSFIPGGTFYDIHGSLRFDSDKNGCDPLDLSLSNIKFLITNGTTTGNLISDGTGNYSIPVEEGTYEITPIVEDSNYMTISPAKLTVTFPTQSSPFNQDFCITANGVHNDLEITILPLIPARPGFDAVYKLIYKNNGNSVLSGTVSLLFNDAVLDFVSAMPNVDSQAINNLIWNYSTLKPFERREIEITLNVNSPMETPAVNIGDRLSFNAIINPVTGDEKPVDNSFALRQSVVGSFDPNDKTCLEGDVLTPELIGEYVHYLIRFENTGTYPAQNIVVKDLIDLSKFDISTLVPTKASHEFVTNISNGNKVEFIFENINLPFDDATNDGYIAFKIKTLPTLATGDSFTNEANIYFDYNFPILTNKATSTFKTLGTPDFAFADYFNVYPNPVHDILNIGIKNTIPLKTMAIYDMLGQIIIAVPNAQNISKVDVSKLTIGNYFLKMNTDKGSSSFKFIKQ
ncbi:T9SS type A sorting domain-containing protein [Flavobacterium frigoris]|uniref:Internalin-related protein n=1 Tax=Flavobacterium frigoris (strain PS1) TaxID=1086011 RepID=H7FVA5_FLAFP|nr:T9SS type A sorting domain-containing protein [Flavobacterium frigoris]EIA07528.1 internalin-related protein [Flavobacterium frigoris PS1]